MFRKVGYFASKKMLLGYIDLKFRNLDDEEEKSTFVEFLLQVLLREESSERVLTYAFNVGLWAQDPLKDKLKEIKVPIGFLFGEQGWVSREIPDALIASKKLTEGS